METFHGVFRGTVINNTDPQQAGRVQVVVPGVLGYSNSWALVASPIGSDAPGTATLGSTVWVMFEGGNPAYPVVLGQLREV